MSKQYVPFSILERIPVQYENVWCFNYQHMMKCLQYAHRYLLVDDEASKNNIVYHFISCYKSTNWERSACSSISEKARWAVEEPRLQTAVMQYIWSKQKSHLRLFKRRVETNVSESNENVIWKYVQEEEDYYDLSAIKKELGVLCEMRQYAVDNEINDMEEFP